MMYSIKETAQLLKCSTSALRYYDRIGLLQPQREQNAYRMYTDQEILELKYIFVLKHSDFSIREIKDVLAMMRGENCVAETEILLESKRQEMLKKIHFLQNLVQLVDQLPALDQINDQEELKVDQFVVALYEDIAEGQR